jgi:hypothetical protein
MTVKAEENNCQLCVTGRAFSHIFPGSTESLSIIQRKFM